MERDGAHIAFRALDLASGDHEGTAATAAGLRFVAPAIRRSFADPHGSGEPREYDQASWTTTSVPSGFRFHELVATWHAHTPPGCWLEVCAQARGAVDTPAAGAWSQWLVLARWADDDEELHPSSVPGQKDDIAMVETDILRCPPGADAWRLRLNLLRPAGAERGPRVTFAGVMVSTRQMGDLTDDCAPSAGGGPGVTLPVPALSQRIHAGHHPEWDGGGSSWCSPTSTTMLLSYWGAAPDPATTAWVDPEYPDPAVYHAVRHCFDYAYHGAGNWSFNAAYAARFGLNAFVTRLRDLTEAERFIRAGIPLAASVRVDPDRLAGAGYTSAGHLVVVAGFTEAGDVVVNDPGAPEPAAVRRVYRRDEFESAWRTGSGGIVYVVHPPTVPLPPRPTEANW